MPRFPNVSCSQCGGDFGPGDNGFSHCDQHPGAARDRLMLEQAAYSELDHLVRALAEILTGGEFIDAVMKSAALEAYFVERQRQRRAEVQPDYYESHEVLGDIVSLESEHQALNGGGPGWKQRWDKAMQRACELFEAA